MSDGSRSDEERYEMLEIPEFLKRDPNETRTEFLERWSKHGKLEAVEPQKKEKAMTTLNELIKSGKLSSALSLNEMRDRYNEACVKLERPNETVTSFADTGVALRKLNGLLATLRAPAPKADPKLKPVSEPKAAKAEPKKDDTEMATKNTKKAPKAEASKKPKGEAKAPKAAKVAAPPVKAPTHAGNVAASTVRETFEAREGSNRDKLLMALAEKQGKPVLVSEVLKAVYGSKNDENRSKLMMVLKGLTVSIETGKLPFAIHKTKNDEGEMTLGLYRTKK